MSTPDKASDLHIAFSANDAYVPYMCVAIGSIIENYAPGKKAHFHILSVDYNEESTKLIADTFAGHDLFAYTIHYIDPSPFESFDMGRYTIYSWLRLVLPDLLSDIDKLLYLDTDILVTDDLSTLADFDMDGAAIATPMDTDTFIDAPFERCGYPKEKQYVCVGVMMMNLKLWREMSIGAKALGWGKANKDKIKYPDQDSINYACQDLKKFLPLRFGVTKSVFSQPYFYAPEYRDQLRECLEHPAIIHYAGCAPWHYESNHTFTDMWINFNKRQPKPVKRYYRATGWLGLKLRIWDLLHPGYQRCEISRGEILRRLNQQSDV